MSLDDYYESLFDKINAEPIEFVKSTFAGKTMAVFPSEFVLPYSFGEIANRMLLEIGLPSFSDDDLEEIHMKFGLVDTPYLLSSGKFVNDGGENNLLCLNSNAEKTSFLCIELKHQSQSIAFYQSDGPSVLPVASTIVELEICLAVFCQHSWAQRNREFSQRHEANTIFYLHLFNYLSINVRTDHFWANIADMFLAY